MSNRRLRLPRFRAATGTGLALPEDWKDRSHACSATWRGKAITDDLSGIGGVDGIAGHGQFSRRKPGRDAGDRPRLAVLESEADKRFRGNVGGHHDGVAGGPHHLGKGEGGIVADRTRRDHLEAVVEADHGRCPRCGPQGAGGDPQAAAVAGPIIYAHATTGFVSRAAPTGPDGTIVPVTVVLQDSASA